MGEKARVATRVAGHFGEFLQGRLGREGPVCLVTAPCPALGVRAEWRAASRFTLRTWPRALLSRQALVRAAHMAARRAPIGRLTLRAEAPPGGGAGMSTAALMAALQCMRAGQPALAPERQTAICHSIEGAVDPLAYPAPERMLWASREARPLAFLPAPPAFEVVGGFDGAGERTDPHDRAFADISDFIEPWRCGAVAGNRAALARLATLSAERNQRLRGGPALEPLIRLAHESGALGICAAHTGSARGLLFAPGDAPSSVEAALRARGLTHVLRFRTPAPRKGADQ